ncbi:MAG TPA: hypothetical protein VMX12_07460, partial [Acidimicrobiia bacterium]|nr:hypothetical protein [Acidimicrobiia bacterium]
GPTPPIFPWRAFVTDDIEGIIPDGVWAIAAVESDECYLRERELASPDLSLLVDQVLDLEGKFAWDNINGSALESDFDAYVDAKADVWKKRLDSGRLTIEKIAMDYRPGQWITNIDGRSVALHAQIVGVRWDVERQQTHLALSTMLASLDGEPMRAEPQPEEEVFGPETPHDFTPEYGRLIRGEKAVPRRFLPDWGRETGKPQRPQRLGIPDMPGDRPDLDRGANRLQEDAPAPGQRPLWSGPTKDDFDAARAAEMLRRRRERNE